MLGTCAGDRAKVDGILDPAAVDLLASRLRTPLQIKGLGVLCLPKEPPGQGGFFISGSRFRLLRLGYPVVDEAVKPVCTQASIAAVAAQGAKTVFS